jgi:3',5'-cyclic AMP phosphodiesterase CpdA
MDITTVADDLAVLHDGLDVRRYDGLAPDTDHVLDGTSVRTLATPDGALLCRFATVNDVHFGETEAGRIDDLPEGPIRRADAGAEPYPEVMNRAAATEMAAIDPAVVVVKGDLSVDGRPEEWAAFEACYRGTFGDRLHVVRGNHDAYRHQGEYAGDQWIELPGLAIALLDTTIPGATTGAIDREQISWLNDQCVAADGPVIVMGHHQQWIGSGPDAKRGEDYFGLHPDSGDALDELAQRHACVIAYTAGHTHRHRVRRMARSGVPSIEVGCTKDFPGTWAEYRVYDGGILQVVHRTSAPEALAWSEQCRSLYSDFGVDYAAYAMGTLADRCFQIALR